jgi:methylthioribose-1-phosphate isomerase
VRFTAGRLDVLDQTLLPASVRYCRARSAAEVVGLIKRLAVRGAPMIGVAAAFGVAVEAGRLPGGRLRAALTRACDRLEKARPTAVNLRWAIDRMRRVVRESGPADRVRARLVNEARAIEAEEVANSLAIARNGARFVPRDATVLTICNTGSLAAPGLGTALGIILQAHLDGKRPRVFACETRPLLQGARLTTLELLKSGVPVRLIADSAAASVIERCDLVLAGADRIARNGDTANKVGTRMLALLARAARRPFVIAAPSSTLDRSIATGAGIPIEERDAAEVRAVGRCRTAPAGVSVFNPAFDVTPARLISAIVTERGVARAPYGRSLRRLRARSS